MLFPRKTQLKSLWCWAAVSETVVRYFSPGKSSIQCKIACKVLDEAVCCDKRNPCNKVESLTVALTKVGRLDKSAERVASFAEVCTQIDGNLPLGVRIRWQGGGAHFVLICGYRVSTSGDEFVEVADPALRTSFVRYDKFVSNYQSSPGSSGGGKWTHSYWIRS